MNKLFQAENPPIITVIGSGNVGFHLATALHSKGLKIQEVFSQNLTKAERLSKICHCSASSDLSLTNTASDLYILPVKDDAILSVATTLQKVLPSEALVVHTSGATPVNHLRKIFKRFGAFYPLQTFSLEKKPEWSEIPICLDAASEADFAFLEKIGGSLSDNLYRVDDAQRAVLHLAAVFANNFSNHLFHLSERLLAEKKLPFDLLRPLILETAKKVQTHSPASMQTGPAVRGDIKTLNRHLELLRSYPEFLEIYQSLSESIIRYKSSNPEL